MTRQRTVHFLSAAAVLILLLLLGSGPQSISAKVRRKGGSVDVSNGKFIISIETGSRAYGISEVPSFVTKRNASQSGSMAPLSGASIAASFLRKQQSLKDRVGLYTPFQLTPGGGERYFLASAAAFQKMGLAIDIILAHDNVCATLSCIARTAELLRVEIDLSAARILVIEKPVDGRMPSTFRYKYFYVIGHGTAPPVMACGILASIYMNQFPFDRNKTFVDQVRWEILSSYDIVLVNSAFTAFHYSKAIVPLMKSLLGTDGSLIPSVTVLHPPVKAVVIDAIAAAERDRDPTVYISVLGRFFQGTQAKGHDVAIALIHRIASITRRPVHLFLIGNVHPSHASHAYVASLQKVVRDNSVPASFLLNASTADISMALSKSTLMWHLTGVNEPQEGGDPASIEHFGIAIVEAMSVGCIPIVSNRGGPLDIVQHGKDGFLANSLDHYAELTLEVMKSPRSRVRAISEAAVEKSKKFDEAVFNSKFKTIVTRSRLATPFKDHVKKSLPRLRQKPLSAALRGASDLVAVIVEPSVSSTFEYATRNVLNMLGPGWRLMVFHTNTSADFVIRALRFVANVEYVMLPQSITQISEYNSFMKNASFWRSLNASKVLLFQSDSMMLRKGIERFLEYDYIGAPWDVEQNDRVRTAIKSGELGGSVGNGGFSLRSVPAMIKICEEHGAESPDEEQEDMFFARYVVKQGFKYPTPRVAYKFCREVAIQSLEVEDASNSPVRHLALHAAWYYMPPEVSKMLMGASWRYESSDSVV
jgi:glycosyltransferase involved in cell wall biosynthesis